MSEAPKETKELDPEEEILIKRKDFKAELQKAHENGTQVKYMILMNFLFAMCEFYADSFKPPNVAMKDFLKFTLYTLNKEYEKKYEPKKDDEEGKQQAQESQVAPEGGHQNVPEGSEGGQEADQKPKEEEVSNV